MIQTIIAGAAGAVVGAAIAVMANVFVLPLVLKQRQAAAAARGASPSVRDTQIVVSIYRYVMPACFTGVSAVASAIQFGGTA